MKVIKKEITREYFVNRHDTKEERLRNGQSITKAIIMGGKSCCGSAYTE